MGKNYLLTVLVSLIYSTGFQAQDIPSQERMIQIETNKGNMLIKLYNETPLHRDNMIKLAGEAFYDQQLFHRVINGFMIQGGDPHSVNAAKGQNLGNGGPGYTVPAEFHPDLIHKKGALAAARKGDQINPEKASSGSQFYLVQGRVFSPGELRIMEERNLASLNDQSREVYQSIGGTPHLDGSYTVFGEIVDGLDVLDSIASVATDAYDRPLEDVVFSISIIK